jgi:hypothetical protein
MDNVPAKNETILRENLVKIQQILEKIQTDYDNSIIDPTNLDDLRRIIKVTIIITNIKFI